MRFPPPVLPPMIDCIRTLRALAAALTFMAVAPLAAAAQTGFQVELTETQDPGSVRVRSWFQQTGSLNAMARTLNRWVRLPHPMTLRAADCPESDVRWVPEQRAVEVCYRMAVRVLGRLAENDSTRRAAGPAMAFLALHGAAHAIVDELDLATTGGEERAVREVMALVLVPEGPETGSRVLASLRTLHGADPGWAEWKWAQTHELTPEHLEDIACLAYGSNPAVTRPYRDAELLAAARARGCAAEYQRLYNGLGRRISRHMNE